MDMLQSYCNRKPEVHYFHVDLISGNLFCWKDAEKQELLFLCLTITIASFGIFPPKNVAIFAYLATSVWAMSMRMLFQAMQMNEKIKSVTI